MSKIVVKVGSNLLTRSDGKPNISNMSALVDQIASLINKGHQIVLVSSGAVACGKSDIKPRKDLSSVEARQLYSAVGQIKLINLYSQFFSSYGIVSGQFLTQKENFASRTLYLNQRSCMVTMLENGVIPIVNENDTVSLTELMFTDNDELSGLIATMIDADLLILLSNVDGIYSGNPENKDSFLITEVEPGRDLQDYIVNTRSKHGRGGMNTKSSIASKIASEGISVIIARGDRQNVLIDLIENPDKVPHTLFKPAKTSLSNVKRWVAHSGSFAKGKVIIDSDAHNALISGKAVSLLPIGVKGFDGNWEEGEIISIYNENNSYIGIGKANIDSKEIALTFGKHGKKPVVHYDYLYID